MTYENLFPDKRLDQRAERIAEAITAHQSVVIHAITENHAEAAGAYRFFANTNVSLEALKQGLTRSCHAQVAGGHKLVLQDTTQLNYGHLAQRLGEDHTLGVIGDNETLGYFLHPSLVIDAERAYCLGLSDVSIWTRPTEGADKNERRYKGQPIEEKESFRWIESIAASQAVLESADHLTMIADRESDIFEVFAAVPDARTDLIVRLRNNRRIREGMLYEHITAQEPAACYSFALREDLRQGREARQAQMEVRYAQVHLRRPDRLSGSSYPGEVPLYVVEAKEVEVPDGQEPIHWRLLTTHLVEDFEAARQIITWYQQRWHIEQYFRLLKSQGFQLEAATLESGAALKRLCLMTLGAALYVLRLLLARAGTNKQAASAVFSKSEQGCIAALMPEWEGSTLKQENPHERGTLGWVSWLIARLGGWKGYRSQRPPGPITYYRGMHRFAHVYQGWKLTHA